MTADELTVEDEITVVRLDWLAAEAEVVQLLPTATPRPAGDIPPTQELAAALERAEQAHRAYLATIRRWAGLSDS